MIFRWRKTTPGCGLGKTTYSGQKEICAYAAVHPIRGSQSFSLIAVESARSVTASVGGRRDDIEQAAANMTTRLYRTLTPDTRERSISGFNGEVQSHPQKKLNSEQHRCGEGRNNGGILTIRHRGGGHKRIVKSIFGGIDKIYWSGEVVTIEYDPDGSADICLLHCRDGEKTYTLHPRGDFRDSFFCPRSSYLH
ncbi:hypothetical protein LguiA_036016 [Lonicera macranthoides]